MTDLAHIELNHVADTTPDAADLLERAWNSHPDRAEHEALRAEADSRGRPLWHEWLEPDPDDPDSLLLVFGPVDPLGGRARRNGRWPRSLIEQP
jgi:hypothetical protein